MMMIPTDLKARTGELTPPGIRVLASAKILADFSKVYNFSVVEAYHDDNDDDGGYCYVIMIVTTVLIKLTLVMIVEVASVMRILM